MDFRASACLAAHLPRPFVVGYVADVDGMVSETRRRRLLCNNELNDLSARSSTGTSILYITQNRRLGARWRKE